MPSKANVAPVPDVEFRVFLVEHGYEIHILRKGKEVGHLARDFAADNSIRKAGTAIIQAFMVMVDKWREHR